MAISNQLPYGNLRHSDGGKNPMGLAATVLYISCLKTGENITQRDISNAAGVAEITQK
jgi:transcription initiation factor TFIIB